MRKRIILRWLSGSTHLHREGRQVYQTAFQVSK